MTTPLNNIVAELRRVSGECFEVGTLDSAVLLGAATEIEVLRAENGAMFRETKAEIETLRATNAELLANYQNMKKNRDDFCAALYEKRAEIETLRTRVHHLDKIKETADRYMDENETLRAELAAEKLRRWKPLLEALDD